MQEAIKKGGVPPFKEVMAADEREFYQRDRGTNYAQSRYLCYYLQERGLLRKFYRRFLADREKDPTGHETLRELLGEGDMTAFQKRWEKFVLKLRFR